MKVSAIQSYGVNSHLKWRKVSRVQEPTITTSQSIDTVDFKGKAAAGATIGGILGAAAITLISGGAAIPLIVGAYTIGGAALGAGVGEVFNDDKEKDNDKKDN